ncbi:hypothetical protein KFK09_007538 [Dendrobium nobile]|uniref:Uncharacterized protein n=1 Tax=Dendrobium nobile TaxID=94219 RepID=A0A8T3BX65_DENNO|nr:hypothetical protein KFK09_007538 [Dendrobium nobile]
MWSVTNHILHVSTRAVSPAPSPALRSSPVPRAPMRPPRAPHDLAPPSTPHFQHSSSRTADTTSVSPELHLKSKTPPQRRSNLFFKNMSQSFDQRTEKSASMLVKTDRNLIQYQAKNSASVRSACSRCLILSHVHTILAALPSVDPPAFR